jgi:Ca2+-binding EF-hand superfamily protein
LGEEKDMGDIEVIISQHGDTTTGAIDLKHFTEFLIKLYGDTGSKEEVLSAFELISKGNPFVDPENILFTSSVCKEIL